MGRNYRKRKTVEEEEDEEDQAFALSLRDKLADTKALQKQRNRTTEEEDEEAQLLPDEAKALQDTFANETTVAEEDPNMLSFIEEELRKRRGETQTVETADVSKTDLQKIEDSLYETPKELQMQEVVEEDGSDRWLTGIVEVQLPVEHRLRNIELTEDAKKALLEKQKRRRYGSDRDRLPGNLSANFNSDPAAGALPRCKKAMVVNSDIMAFELQVLVKGLVLATSL
eukprot:gene2870-3670_t